MEYTRVLDLPSLLSKKSHFLFGPRSTGKSFLIQKQLADQALKIDLLRSDVLLRLSANPSALETMIGAAGPKGRCVVIDEIQKIPVLLDEIQRLMEEKRTTFVSEVSPRSTEAVIPTKSWMPTCKPTSVRRFGLRG